MRNLVGTAQFGHSLTMTILIDFLAGIVALLAAAALSQFGIDLTREAAQPEIKRLPECSAPATPSSSDTPRC